MTIEYRPPTWKIADMTDQLLEDREATEATVGPDLAASAKRAGIVIGWSIVGLYAALPGLAVAHVGGTSLQAVVTGLLMGFRFVVQRECGRHWTRRRPAPLPLLGARVLNTLSIGFVISMAMEHAGKPHLVLPVALACIAAEALHVYRHVHRSEP